jgi:hypothetical protein
MTDKGDEFDDPSSVEARRESDEYECREGADVAAFSLANAVSSKFNARLVESTRTRSADVVGSRTGADDTATAD